MYRRCGGEVFRGSEKGVGGMNHGRDSGECGAISVRKKQQLRSGIAIYKKRMGWFVSV